ncbi:hypothetical protein ZWY2020_001709, partial [Hordeum vulgare]
KRLFLGFERHLQVVRCVDEAPDNPPHFSDYELAFHTETYRLNLLAGTAELFLGLIPLTLASFFSSKIIVCQVRTESNKVKKQSKSESGNDRTGPAGLAQGGRRERLARVGGAENEEDLWTASVNFDSTELEEIDTRHCSKPDVRLSQQLELGHQLLSSLLVSERLGHLLARKWTPRQNQRNSKPSRPRLRSLKRRNSSSKISSIDDDLGLLDPSRETER